VFVVYFLICWVVSWVLCYVHLCTFILDNMILYENKISILIVIADLEGFIQLYYLIYVQLTVKRF